MIFPKPGTDFSSAEAFASVGMTITGMPALNAIRAVVDAPPGIVTSADLPLRALRRPLRSSHHQPMSDPRPPFPIGWFAVAPSADLAPGGLIERTFLGEQAVAFRTESGQPAVVSAYCPHLGANLAARRHRRRRVAPLPVPQPALGPDGVVRRL